MTAGFHFFKNTFCKIVVVKNDETRMMWGKFTYICTVVVVILVFYATPIGIVW